MEANRERTELLARKYSTEEFSSRDELRLAALSERLLALLPQPTKEDWQSSEDVLARLEEIEERAHARLMRAINAGNPFQVKAAQEFYLRCSETLRRLDLAVETERRTALEQIPKRHVSAVAIAILCCDCRSSNSLVRNPQD